MVQPLWKMFLWLLKKLNIGFSYLLEIPLLDTYARELKTEIQADMFRPMFTAALFTIVKREKQLKHLPTDYCINIECVLYIQWNSIQLKKKK